VLYLVVCDGVCHLVDALHRARRHAESVAAEQRRLADELGQANRAKDHFLALVSHELRSPLTAVVGWTDALKNGTLPPAQMSKAVHAINRNARIQAQLISDLLDEAQITSGKLRLDPGLTRVGDFVDAAVETVEPAARARDIQLRAHGDLDTLVWGDADRLQQVVWNLLSNAVKFTPPGGHVTVEVQMRDRHVSVRVTDDGPGLRPDFIPHAFERFRQDAGSRGLGLGLAIVKDLVEMHGGTVTAANRRDASGAVLEIVLPEVADAVDLHRVADPARKQRPAPVLAGVHVLVVDDERDARDLLRWVLADLGAEVVTVGSVGDALAAVTRRKPDVILADIVMPDEDGYALLRQVRSLAGDAIPTAAVTAMSTEAERARTVAAGFALHLAKPVRPDHLADAVLARARRRAS
jgi:CheY-like chemotaxis protein